MKNMKNFAAQQLSKKEMNTVKGGAKRSYTCTTTDFNNHVINTFQIEVDEAAGDEYWQRVIASMTPIGSTTTCTPNQA